MSQTYPKVTIVGAGNVGATTALLLLQKEIANVVMIDVADGIAKGKALDLMHMRSNEHFGPSVIGTGDYGDTTNSDLIIITAGVPRKPSMSREDLIDINAAIMCSVLEEAIPASPDACYIIVTNPLDVLTNMAALLVDVPHNRLFGMGGVLDTARFTYAIAAETGANPAEIKALVIGAHGEAMVPIPSVTTVNGEPLTSVVDAYALARIIEATVQGGAEVVRFLETGSAFYAPASSILKMVEAILGDTGEVFSSCVRLQGEYGISGVSLCVPAVLGAEGVRNVEELDLSYSELLQLHASAESIKEQLKRFEQ